MRSNCTIVASTLEGLQLEGMCEFERKREVLHVMFCIAILSFPTPAMQFTRSASSVTLLFRLRLCTAGLLVCNFHLGQSFIRRIHSDREWLAAYVLWQGAEWIEDVAEIVLRPKLPTARWGERRLHCSAQYHCCPGCLLYYFTDYLYVLDTYLLIHYKNRYVRARRVFLLLIQVCGLRLQRCRTVYVRTTVLKASTCITMLGSTIPRTSEYLIKKI